MPGDRIPHSALPPAEMGTAQQEFPVDNAKVYVVMRGSLNDAYDSQLACITSVHTTQEGAVAVCQAKTLEQLEEQLDAIRAQPSYVPELRYEWYVRTYVLES